MTIQTSSSDNGEADRQHPRRKLLRSILWVAAVLVPLVLILIWLPAIVARTGLRDAVLKQAIAQPGLEIKSGKAELGWTKPVRLENLNILRSDQRLSIHASQVQLEKSWLQLWWTSPNVGNVQIEEPRIEFVIQDLMQQGAGPQFDGSDPISLSAQVENASLIVKSEGHTEPVIEMTGVDSDISIDEHSGAHVITVGRTRFLDHFQLSPELCRDGLQLLAPIVADATEVTGTVSLDLHHFQLPLNGRDRLTEVEGVLELHDVTSGIKNPVLQEAVGNLATLFDFEMPQTIEVARDAKIPFSVRDDRVYHRGIEFLIPTVSKDRKWRTEGSVGFDESLDLTLWAPIPADDISDTTLAKLLSAKPLKLHVGGTIQEPEIALPEDAALADQLRDALLGSADEELGFEDVLDRVEAVLETGEAAAPIWQWGYDWFQGS